MITLDRRTGCEPPEIAISRIKKRIPAMSKDDTRRTEATIKALRTGKWWRP